MGEGSANASHSDQNARSLEFDREALEEALKHVESLPRAVVGAVCDAVTYGRIQQQAKKVTVSSLADLWGTIEIHVDFKLPVNSPIEMYYDRELLRERLRVINGAYEAFIEEEEKGKGGEGG